MSRTKHYTRYEEKPHRQKNTTRLTKLRNEWYFPFVNDNTNNGNNQGAGKTSMGVPLSKSREVHAHNKVLDRRRDRHRRNRENFDE